MSWRMLFACLVVGASAQFAGALDDDEPTLPPVVVRPSPDSTPGNYYGPPNTGVYRGEGRGDGSISWYSDAIQTDNTLVGPYSQPVWTTQRPFATSRAYVLPAGTAQFEQWVRPTWKKGHFAEYRMLEEFAIGLPGRFQLDLYERWNIEPNNQNVNTANHEGVQIELRWALADWDEVFLNPTFYIEWVERGGRQNKADKYEAKLLLAEQFGEQQQLFYSSNLILEQETADERETEIAWSHALTTPLIERKLMAGFEMFVSGTTVEGNRSHPEVVVMIGPSVQVRPTPRTFFDVVGLFGTTSESPVAQMYAIFGYQFGARSGPVSGSISGPAATRGN